jgi:hypothetical protein
VGSTPKDGKKSWPDYDREPDRSGPVIRLPDDGAPEPTEEDLARLDEMARFWQRPDVQLLYEQRDRAYWERIDRERQQQQKETSDK